MSWLTGPSPGVQRNPGDFFAAASARPDAGKKKQIADAFCVRKGPDRFGGALAFEMIRSYVLTAGDRADNKQRLLTDDNVVRQR